MYYIRNVEDGSYYSGYCNGVIVWKSHPTRALYSRDREYLKGVIDTLVCVLDVCHYEFEIVFIEE